MSWTSTWQFANPSLDAGQCTWCVAPASIPLAGLPWALVTCDDFMKRSIVVQAMSRSMPFYGLVVTCPRILRHFLRYFLNGKSRSCYD